MATNHLLLAIQKSGWAEAGMGWCNPFAGGLGRIVPTTKSILYLLLFLSIFHRQPVGFGEVLFDEVGLLPSPPCAFDIAVRAFQSAAGVATGGAFFLA